MATQKAKAARYSARDIKNFHTMPENATEGLCWYWISFYWLRSKQHNVYYMTSSNDFKLCDFKRCFLVGFLWSCLCHLWYTKSRYPKPCLAYWDLCTYVLLVPLFQAKAFLCLPLCLIDKFTNSYNCRFVCYNCRHQLKKILKLSKNKKVRGLKRMSQILRSDWRH